MKVQVVGGWLGRKFVGKFLSFLGIAHGWLSDSTCSNMMECPAMVVGLQYEHTKLSLNYASNDWPSFVCLFVYVDSFVGCLFL